MLDAVHAASRTTYLSPHFAIVSATCSGSFSSNGGGALDVPTCAHSASNSHRLYADRRVSDRRRVSRKRRVGHRAA
jgi:hypothetical protein